MGLPYWDRLRRQYRRQRGQTPRPFGSRAPLVFFLLAWFAAQEMDRNYFNNESLTAETQPVEETSLTHVTPHVVLSDTSLTCRICQLSEKETDEKLQRTHCGCRGSIGRCHRSCLVQWVRHSRSNKCELCQKPFRHVRIIAPHPHTDDDPDRSLSSCATSRRRYFMAIFAMLLLTTGCAAALTFVSMDEYETAQKKWLESLSGDNPLPDSTVDDRSFYYGLSLSVLVFCACFTLGVLLLWVVIEVHCQEAGRAELVLPSSSVTLNYEEQISSDSEGENLEEFVV